LKAYHFLFSVRKIFFELRITTFIPTILLFWLKYAIMVVDKWVIG